mgnify:FL=1|jgi:hypothetical protein|tara:strand:- start:6253 stop:6621 length:369 start_codon:yes stop_codon:yes gene_type:complete
MNSKRGYVEVEIGGKLRTLHFSMNFWCHFTDTLNIGLNDLDKFFTKGINVSTIRALIYSGLIAYDQEERNNIDYTIYDVGSWLEDFDSEQLTKVMNTLSQSRILGNDLNMGIQRNNKNQKKK